jgi:hypothetical protein
MRQGRSQDSRNFRRRGTAGDVSGADFAGTEARADRREHARGPKWIPAEAPRKVTRQHQKQSKELAQVWHGPLASLAIALSKAKVLLAVFKLKFLFSLFAFLGFYCALFGMRFGIGFAVLILIHEMGHYVDIKRRGLAGGDAGNAYDFSKDLSTIVYARPGGHQDLYLLSQK